MNKNQQKLNAYSKELGLIEPWTIDDLINSHRDLRKDAIDHYKKSNESYYKAQEDYKKRYEELYRKQEYLKVEELKQMTLLEIVELIGS